MTAVPEPSLPDAPLKRDLLGNFCFYLHFAVMIYIVLGWLAPWHPMQIFYVVFVPLTIISWRFNKDSCVLNNLESWIRSRQWRDPGNVEEGAWLLTMARNLLGLPVTPEQVNMFTYAVMVILWGLGLVRIF